MWRILPNSYTCSCISLHDSNIHTCFVQISQISGQVVIPAVSLLMNELKFLEILYQTNSFSSHTSDHFSCQKHPELLLCVRLGTCSCHPSIYEFIAWCPEVVLSYELVLPFIFSFSPIFPFLCVAWALISVLTTVWFYIPVQYVDNCNVHEILSRFSNDFESPKCINVERIWCSIVDLSFTETNWACSDLAAVYSVIQFQ